MTHFSHKYFSFFSIRVKKEKKKTMPGQTKMIIITTNEDLINKFQLNANKHTQIFDLDNHQMDLSFLNQVLFSHIFS